MCNCLSYRPQGFLWLTFCHRSQHWESGSLMVEAGHLNTERILRIQTWAEVLGKCVLSWKCSRMFYWPGNNYGETKNRLSCSEFKSQLTGFFFQIPKSSAPPGMTSFTTPVSFSIWDFYSDISDCYSLPALAWTPALNVCT